MMRMMKKPGYTLPKPDRGKIIMNDDNDDDEEAGLYSSRIRGKIMMNDDEGDAFSDDSMNRIMRMMKRLQYTLPKPEVRLLG